MELAALAVADRARDGATAGLQGSPPPTAATGYRGIFVVGFAVVFAIALLAQALLLPWRNWFPGSEGKKSLIGGVSAAVYGFMEHIP
jgi:hypothetical protein